MFDWIRRRRLSADANKKLLLVTARAQEALIETHVSNILDLLATLRDEVDVDRALELYLERIPMDETLATTVSNRLLARLESPSERQQRFKHVFREQQRRR